MPTESKATSLKTHHLVPLTYLGAAISLISSVWAFSSLFVPSDKCGILLVVLIMAWQFLVLGLLVGLPMIFILNSKMSLRSSGLPLRLLALVGFCLLLEVLEIFVLRFTSAGGGGHCV